MAFKILSVSVTLLLLCTSGVMSYCYPRDCLTIQQDAKSHGVSACSGVYTVKPDTLPPFEVYCDMETDGGGWTVFQRRMDGSEDFYRTWKNYQNGFGKLEREFWLGLDNIQRLTVPNSLLRVDMEDFGNVKRYSKYNLFRVGNAVAKYKISVTGYSGNGGDSLSYHNGAKFSTRDQDNDNSGGSCAVSYKGAWWYKACHHSNLNGYYLYGSHSSYANGVNWYHFKQHRYSLKFTEMKIRRA